MSEGRVLISVGDAVVNAVVAYRTWTIRTAGGRAILGSRVMDYSWPQDYEAVAWCPNRCGLNILPTPGSGCRCGLYGFKHQRQVDNSLSTGFYPHIGGEIYMWGHMVEHRSGWRSSHARIAALYVPKLERHLARAELAAHQYGVPLVKLT